MSCLALPLAAPGEWGFCIYNPFPVHNRSESACCCVVRPEGPAWMKSDGSEAAGHTAPDSTPPGSGVRLGRLTKAADLHPERGPTRLGTPGLDPDQVSSGPAPRPPPPTPATPRTPRRPVRLRPPTAFAPSTRLPGRQTHRLSRNRATLVPRGSTLPSISGWKKTLH